MSRIRRAWNWLRYLTGAKVEPPPFKDPDEMPADYTGEAEFDE